MKYLKPFNESESIDFDNKYYLKLSFVRAWAYSKDKPLIPLTTRERKIIKDNINSNYNRR